jgi:hypothetical protein
MKVDSIVAYFWTPAKLVSAFLAAHSRCTTETIASCLVGQAIGFHVAQHRDHEQSRRPHRPIGLVELAGEARRRDDIAGAAGTGAAALAMRDQHRLAETQGDRRGSVADADHQRAAADRSAVDPVRGRPR